MGDDNNELRWILDEIKALKKRLDELEKRVLEYERRRAIKVEELRPEIEIKVEEIPEKVEEIVKPTEEVEKAPSAIEKEFKPEILISRGVEISEEVKEEVPPSEVEEPTLKEPSVIPSEAIRVEEEEILSEEAPLKKSLEIAVGMSLFMRIGLLFLIIASIIGGYWLYTAVIYRLPLSYKIGIAYSFGIILLLFGLRLFSKDVPRWYAESASASGIAALIGISVLSYTLNVFDLRAFALVMGVILVGDFVLSRIFDSVAMFIEALINAIFIGFVIAWWFPSFPYAQIYMLALFVLLFNRLSESARCNSLFVLSAYLSITGIAIAQSVAMLMRGESNPILGAIAALSIAVIYLFYDTQKVSRIYNSIAALSLIMVTAVILFTPPELILGVILLTYVINFIERLKLDIKISMHQSLVEVFLGNLAALAIPVYGLFITEYHSVSSLSINSSITPVITPFIKTYLGFILQGFLFLKIVIDRKLYTTEPEKVTIEKGDAFAYITLLLIVYGIMVYVTADYLGYLAASILVLAFFYLPDMLGLSEEQEIKLIFHVFTLSIYTLLIAYRTTIISVLLVSIILIDTLQLVTAIRLLESESVFIPRYIMVSLATLVATYRIVITAITHLPEISLNIVLESYVPLYICVSSLLIWFNKYKKQEQQLRTDYTIVSISIPYLIQLVLLFGFSTYVIIHIVSLVLLFSLIECSVTAHISNYVLPLFLMSIFSIYSPLIDAIIPITVGLVSIMFIKLLSAKIHEMTWNSSYNYAIMLLLLPLIIRTSYMDVLISTLILASYTVSHLYISIKYRDTFNYAISVYGLIGLHSLITLEPLLLFNIEISILYFVTIYILLSVIALLIRDLGLVRANLLVFPIPTILFYRVVNLQNWFYFIETLFIVASATIIATKEKIMAKDALPLYYVPESVFLFSITGYTALLAYYFGLPPIIIYMSVFIVLSKLNALTRFAAGSFVFYSHVLMFLIATNIISLSLEIALVVIYANAVVFHLTPWVKEAKKITHALTPYELAIGYLFMFKYSFIATIIILATISLISVLIAICKTGALPALSIIAVFTLISLSPVQPWLLIICSAIILASLTVIGIQTYSWIPSLLLPSFVIMYMANAIPVQSLIAVAAAHIISNELNRIRRREHRPIFSLLPSYIVFIKVSAILFYTLIADPAHSYVLLLIFYIVLSLSSWFLDRKMNLEELSHYITLSSIAIALLIFYNYGLRIETTVLMGVLGVLTLIGGLTLDRKYVRITGVSLMMLSAVKVAYDIIMQISALQLSMILKVALGSLVIGIVFLIASYLYLRFYKTRIARVIQKEKRQ